MEKNNTTQQFEQVMASCRELFAKKLHDYGAAWRIMRPVSVTDQIFIKANRIRSLEVKGVSLVGEGIRPEVVASVNYGIVGLVQWGGLARNAYQLVHRPYPYETLSHQTD